MKVYVITKGAYSDYHICGVSLDKEEAQTIARLCSDGWGTAEVETYDTKDFSPFLKGGKYYSIWLRGENVTTNEVDIEDYNLFGQNKVVYYKRYDRYSVYVIAKDREHAQKIGLDLIYQYKYKKGLKGEEDD